MEILLNPFSEAKLAILVQSSLLLALLLTVSASSSAQSSIATASRGSQPVQATNSTGPLRRKSQESTPGAPAIDSASEQDESSDELAPAAVQLDVSRSSRLLQVLYAATRETKQQPTLERLNEARDLIESGSDLQAVDQQGRTALHWTVFGSSYTRKEKIKVAYEEIANALIARGVELNREDMYNNTALDYLLYSPNFEMQTLLIEHGANSGFLAAFLISSNRFRSPKRPPPIAAVPLLRRLISHRG